MNNQCGRAEVLAGAIALGEADEAQREEYRKHVAHCGSCLESLGGEREIERVMAVVAQARDAETWEPAQRRLGERSRTRIWQAAAAALAAALAVSFSVHALLPALVHAPSIAPKTVALAHVAPLHAGPRKRVAVSVPAPPRKVAKAASPRRRSIVVIHNVITHHGNVVTQTTTSTTEVAQAQPAPVVTVPASNVPIWRRDEAMPPLTTQPPAATSAPVFAGRAESMDVTPVTTVRNVMPLGGDAAINPRPAPIAYAEDAEGTTAFEVEVDERGIPTKCTITKSSGYRVLDVAVCKAAMAARYSPRLVNGKATPGVYRDAFTFRATNDDDSQF